MNLQQQPRSCSNWKWTYNSSHFTNPTLSIKINQISFSWNHPNHINSWINTLKIVTNTSFAWHNVGRNKVDDIWFKVGLRWLFDQNRLSKHIVEVSKFGQITSPIVRWHTSQLLQNSIASLCRVGHHSPAVNTFCVVGQHLNSVHLRCQHELPEGLKVFHELEHTVLVSHPVLACIIAKQL